MKPHGPLRHWMVGLFAVAPLGNGPTPFVASAQDTTVVVTRFGVEQSRVGTNVFRVTVRNNTTTPVPFGVSLRAESPSRAVQKSHYRLLQPRETASLVYEYELPDEGYRLLIAYYGQVRAMPTEREPFPDFTERQLKRFARFPGARDQNRTVGPLVAGSPSFAPSQTTRQDSAKSRLSDLLGLGRARSPALRPRVTASDRVGPYRLKTVQIATEPNGTIDLLFIRRADACRRLPTILYLTGNPPGRKESGIGSGMFLADLGFQVVAIDRRESARHTGRGEFLSAIADPVFDATIAVDYLLTLEDVDTARIGVFGFSRGAEEGMFLSVLHHSVRAAVLVSRLVDQDSLFSTAAWLPTLYSEDILSDLGLDSLIGNWEALTARITPSVSAAALTSYRHRYPYFDQLNPAAVLPLLAPRPVLVVTGARDQQIVLSGALALDDRVQAVYRELGIPDRAGFLIMPRSDHGMSGAMVRQIAEWFASRLGAPTLETCH